MIKVGHLPSTPAIGVAAIITFEQKILLGFREKPDQEPCWQLPGGWLLQAESPPDAIIREIDQELGIKISSPEFVAISNNIFSADKHSVSLYFEVKCHDPENIGLKQHHKCSLWQWIDWNKLPSNLFYPLKLLTETGYNPLNLNKNQSFVAF